MALPHEAAPAEVEASSLAAPSPLAPATEPGAVRVVAAKLLRPDGIAIGSRGTMYGSAGSPVPVAKEGQPGHADRGRLRTGPVWDETSLYIADETGGGVLR